jgi:hypothetical protein
MAALAALPRKTEIVSGYPPDDRAGAFEIVERSFIEAARDYGCPAQSRVYDPTKARVIFRYR